MAHSIQPSCLTWINLADGKRPKNPETRTLIRKQAMSKAAAARKRSSNLDRRNLRQLTVYQGNQRQDEGRSGLSSPPNGETEPAADGESLNSIESVVPFFSELEIGGLHGLAEVPLADWIPASPSSTGYEAMRIRFEFDVVKLSGLTAIHIGSAAARPLRAKPDFLLEILRYEKWSYFEYLPSRFGQTKCLDDAICCVAALVRQWITWGGKPDVLALELYSRAVRSLQVALNDPLLCHQPDVLCATQILSIFDFLDLGRDLAHIPHIKGIATLIQLRGPQGYQTDFEKSLLLAQAGPIFTDAVNCNTYCFLEEPAWQATYQSIISERSASIPFADAYVTLWACMSTIPSLLRNVRSIVCSGDEASTTSRETLLSNALGLRSELMAMGNREKLATTEAYGTTTYSSMRQEEAQSAARFEVLGAFALNLLKVERLIVALDSTLALPMEVHAQELAFQILELERAGGRTNSRATLFLACRAITARGVLLTADEWYQEASCRAPNTVMAKAVFERWIELTNPQRVANEWTDENIQTWRGRLTCR
ncbi:MAG: hypothetical protein L6R40_004372 [Gallowayella cf. fulva]|nr:MAG: hypothetical protein L6R40_004372 [Xanthomendoza cf. fulva]